MLLNKSEWKWMTSVTRLFLEKIAKNWLKVAGFVAKKFRVDFSCFYAFFGRFRPTLVFRIFEKTLKIFKKIFKKSWDFEVLLDKILEFSKVAGFPDLATCRHGKILVANKLPKVAGLAINRQIWSHCGWLRVTSSPLHYPILDALVNDLVSRS